MKQLNTIGRYFRSKYGCTVYKVPLSIGGFTFPNIDGTVAKGGCTFCENDSFSPNLQKSKNRFKLNPHSATNPFLSTQIEQLKLQYNVTKNRLQKKFKAKKFIAYFQSFTNTYAPIDTLRALYEQALILDDCIGLSIGTRTDCMSDEILEYLCEIQNRGFEVWVEYGVQSIYNETLIAINRGHDSENLIEWITKTKKAGLKVCAHLIFGLPNETKEMMLETVKKVIELDVDSIKFHPLYVVKNTLLTKDYSAGKFIPISEDEYIQTLMEAISLLPEHIIIQRTTAGISDDSLLGPAWCKNKHAQINKIKQELVQNKINY